MSPMPLKNPSRALSLKILSQYAGDQPDLLCQLIQDCAPEVRISPCIPAPLDQQCFFAADGCKGLQLALIDFGQAIQIAGKLPQTLGIAFFERSTLATLNDVHYRFKAFEPFFLSPNQAIEITLPRKAQLYYLQLSPIASGESLQTWSEYVKAANASQDVKVKNALSRAVQHYLQQTKYFPTAAARQRHLEQMRARLVDIVGCLARDKPVAVPREQSRDPRLQRVSDFIEQQHQWDYQPEVLCEMAGMSLRNLYYAFERDYATTPFRFHRNCKLGRVRFALLQDPAQVHPISWYATNEGFFHLSRFASQYRQLFGELPSATVRHLQLIANNHPAGCCQQAHRSLADCRPEACELWQGCQVVTEPEEWM